MNRIVLFSGAATMTIVGWLFGFTEFGAGGLVLMWIGLSLEGKP